MPLSYWLQGYTASVFGSSITNAPSRFEADEAVRDVGTNAMPLLLWMIRQKESPLKETISRILQKQSFIRWRYSPPWLLNAQAQGGFRALGPSASNAVPDLMEILEQDISILSRQVVVSALAAVGPAAKSASPLLLQALTNSDGAVRAHAAFALGKIEAQPESVIPDLIRALRDSSPHVRLSALVTLSEYGTNARLAVPALLEWYQNETNRPSNLQAESVDAGTLLQVALEKINAEAAAQSVAK